MLETLSAAFWALEHHHGFEEVVVAAVNLGDDADTVGAVAGALAGAREGVGALPERWLTHFRDVEPLADLARGLHRMAEGETALVAGEASRSEGSAAKSGIAGSSAVILLLSLQRTAPA